MDHLPDFGGAERIHVPYLGAPMYDGGSFEGYPQRAGWDELKLWHNDLQGRSKQDAAAFLQTWIYFGLLYQVFGLVDTSFDPFHFLQGESTTITTKSLPEYVLRLRDMEQTKGTEEKRKRYATIRACLDKITALTARYCQIYRGQVVEGNQKDYSVQQQLEYALRRRPLKDEKEAASNATRAEGHKVLLLPPEVSLSILVLADTVTKAGFEITGFKFSLDWGGSHFLVERMVQAGWCPRAIATCIKGQQIQNLYCASTLGPPSQQQDHNGCNEKLCKWEQVDTSTYCVKHRPECEICECKGPSMEEYIGIFKAGRTPVVCWKKVEGSFEVVLLDTTQVESYVAISHVWADGLGNQHENKLPTCQLHHLQAMVKKLHADSGSSSPGCFWWCDTLCIPVQDKYKLFRKIEIRNMRRIYQGAAKVLALDSTLLSISKDTYVVEHYLRLKLSNWARRLWTLQEAKLSQNVHIQFADGTRTITDLAVSIRAEAQRESQYLYMRFGQLARAFLAPFIQGTAQDPSQQLQGIWMQLQWRATSHVADEAVCLATVLGLDPGPVLDVPSEDHEGRMIKLIQLVQKLPLLLVFQPPPRLDREGFRWAPTSFLNCFREVATNPFREMPGFGTIGPDDTGLTLALPGFELLFEAATMPMSCTDFVISHAYEGSQVLSTVSYWYGSDREKKGLDGNNILQCPVVIPMQAKSIKGEPAILAGISGRDGTIRVDFFALVLVSMTAPNASQEELVVYQTREYDADQRWLLY